MLGLEIRLVNDTVVQYYDEFNSCFGVDLDLKDEKLFLTIKEWRMINEFGTSPIINEVGLNDEQYLSLLEEIQFILTFVQRYLNRIVFSEGIELNFSWVVWNTELIYRDDAIVLVYDS